MARTFPEAALEKLLKRGGAPRVSLRAKEALRKELETLGGRVAAEATRLAAHAGRRTVDESDIRLAFRFIAQSA